MTECLYYIDSYLRHFAARITGRADDGRTVYLDRTAFYLTSGGQPFDTGSIAGAAVLDVVDEDVRIAHKLAGILEGVVEAADLSCAVDWARRFDHMQQDTGRRLLSAVFEELFHLKTISFHLGGEPTIDIESGGVESPKGHGHHEALQTNPALN
jgi:alanyl-tRNA synthetase